ncbi:MAG: FtsK/SpoIIIE domain-containing protein [Planctomycetota bacterium]
MTPDDPKRPDGAAAPADVRRFDAVLRELGERMKALIADRKAADTAVHAVSFRTHQALEGARDGQARAGEEEQARLTAALAAREKELEQAHARRTARAEELGRTLKARLRDDQHLAQEKHDQDLTQARQRSAKALESKMAQVMAEHTYPAAGQCEALAVQGRKILAMIEVLADRHGVDRAGLNKPSVVDSLDQVHKIDEAVIEGAGAVRSTTAALHDLKLAGLTAGRAGAILIYSMIVLMHTAGLVFAHRFGVALASLPWLALSTAALCLLTPLAVRLARRQVRSTVRALWVGMNNAVNTLVRVDRAERERVAMDATGEERIRRMLAAEKTIEENLATRMAALRLAQDSLAVRLERLQKRVAARRVRDRERFAVERAAAVQAVEETRRARVAAIEADLRREETESSAGRDRLVEGLTEEWNGALADFNTLQAAVRDECRRIHPAWDNAAWADRHLPSDFPTLVPVGAAAVDLSRLAGAEGQETGFPFPAGPAAVQAALGFPGSGALYIRANPEERAQALAVLENAILRVFTSFPAAKVRMIFIDPVGLGQSFAAFMRLADFAEPLVTSRIWTETAHIDRQLADLTEHMETVIQKYLRNRYTTVDEYNREAGMMAEPYRFLVVADFPTGFSDRAVERLAAILTSGPRCGVFTLVMHDGRQKLPAAVEAAGLRRTGLALRTEGTGLLIDGAGFAGAPFTPEPPPAAAQITALLELVGREAQLAARVEVPFPGVAPDAAHMWSLNCDEDFRVPIGQVGADRLQYFGLGRGTQQHALIGGRTGSGKSTLFHVLITNAALWFSPRELEFYLIDFKKGVEFKRFATYRLPHARAIGIESDREFGVSVLRRVNDELDRRGELFRKAGAQNLAGFRRAATGVVLPRIMLVIDEFQEFFTADDAAAQDAALYLDRFVRQGRAFGIHIILGSQTLSGIYTLAKSTLGQMGVRIALQCNESDSHLILGEDNTAARLLARPGEAIYNDMSGLIDGNQPFQVVWLPEEVQEDYLGRVLAKAAAEGWRPETPPVIFEGNAPAEIEGNRLLFDLLARPADPAQALERAWIGEYSSIKGPAEVHFEAGAGGNLLIAGQHRDAAFAVTAGLLISLAARHAPGTVEFAVLTAGDRDEYLDHFKRLAAVMPHGLALVPPQGVKELFDRLETRWKGETAATGPRTPFYLVAFGVHRMRALRQSDEFAFSSDRPEGPPPGERFAGILTDGPETGVHSIVWCDGLANLNCSFSRKTMREFDLRILFQMSASDSSELIDDAVANTLGLHGALLAVEHDGTIEKFRPYSIPGPEVLEKVRNALARKFA